MLRYLRLRRLLGHCSFYCLRCKQDVSHDRTTMRADTLLRYMHHEISKEKPNTYQVHKWATEFKDLVTQICEKEKQRQ